MLNSSSLSAASAAGGAAAQAALPDAASSPSVRRKLALDAALSEGEKESGAETATACGHAAGALPSAGLLLSGAPEEQAASLPPGIAGTAGTAPSSKVATVTVAVAAADLLSASSPSRPTSLPEGGDQQHAALVSGGVPAPSSPVSVEASPAALAEAASPAPSSSSQSSPLLSLSFRQSLTASWLRQSPSLEDLIKRAVEMAQAQAASLQPFVHLALLARRQTEKLDVEKQEGEQGRKERKGRKEKGTGRLEEGEAATAEEASTSAEKAGAAGTGTRGGGAVAGREAEAGLATPQLSQQQLENYLAEAVLKRLMQAVFLLEEQGSNTAAGDGASAAPTHLHALQDGASSGSSASPSSKDVSLSSSSRAAAGAAALSGVLAEDEALKQRLAVVAGSAVAVAQEMLKQTQQRAPLFSSFTWRGSS